MLCLWDAVPAAVFHQCPVAQDKVALLPEARVKENIAGFPALVFPRSCGKRMQIRQPWCATSVELILGLDSSQWLHMH